MTPKTLLERITARIEALRQYQNLETGASLIYHAALMDISAIIREEFAKLPTDEEVERVVIAAEKRMLKTVTDNQTNGRASNMTIEFAKAAIAADRGQS